MNLIIVDFDGTLCNSDLKPHRHKGDWWGNLESLKNIPEINGPLLQEIDEYKQSLCKIVIMTGRTEIFNDRIVEILEHHNVLKSYDYDELITQPLKTFVNTKAYKKEMLKALLRQYPDVETVIAYDDKDMFKEPYEEVCKTFGVALEYKHTPNAFPQSMKRITFDKNQKDKFFEFIKGNNSILDELGRKVKDVVFCDLDIMQEHNILSSSDRDGNYRVDLYVIDLIEDENMFSFYLNDHPTIASCGF